MTPAVRRLGLAWLRALVPVAATVAVTSLLWPAAAAADGAQARAAAGMIDRSGGTPGHMMDRMWGVAWGWALLWLLFGVALIVLVVLAIAWLVRSLRAGGTGPIGDVSPASARDALDMRYARGEISREEYLQARRDLEGPAG